MAYPRPYPLPRSSRNVRRNRPGWSYARHPEAPPCPFPLCFTEASIHALLDSVGSRPAESGAKGFGPLAQLGFDVIEYDASGSESAGGTVYAPDERWGAARQAWHMSAAAQRLWTGDAHSHPGDLGWPSGRAGRGLGDLGYVEFVFEQNESMEYFLIPILTRTATDHVTIHAWVCQRGDIGSPMIAEVKVCEASEFPERVFNPTWVASLGGEVPVVWVWFHVDVPPGNPAGPIVICGTVASLASGLELRKLGPARWGGAVALPLGQHVEWKVTRGDWSSVEKGAWGEEIPNRVSVVSNSPCKASVASWADGRGE